MSRACSCASASAEPPLRARTLTRVCPLARQAYIAPKACHDPFQPAPWYVETWEEGWPAHAPRPPSYNLSRSVLSEHHPTISCRPAFGNQTEACIDRNFKDRWRTLLSVDDVISEVFVLTESLGVAAETYYIYSSDQGC